jgi:hypothetical protein
VDTGNRSSISRVALLALLAAGAWSCGRSPIGTSLEHEPASVVLELKEAPADILCIVVTIAGSREEKRRLDVPADGPASFVLRRLPIGLVVFSAEAHPTACSNLSEAAEPTWSGGPVSAQLKAGPNGTILIQMFPAVRAGVTIRFDGGAGPTCAQAGYACATTADCCAGNSCVFGADPSVGRCQPIPAAEGDAGAAPEVTPDVGPEATPDAGPPGVSALLTGNQYYVVYPAGGAVDCQRSAGMIYTATVAAGDPDRCIPNGLGALVPVPVRDLQVCTPGGSCAPCTAASCLPASCFQTLPPPSFLGCGPTLRKPTGAQPFVYLLFQDFADSRSRPPSREGLPMVLAPTETGMPGMGQGNVVIRPPLNYGPIVIGNMLPEDGAGGESCDANSMCGVLPLWGTSSYSFSTWSVSQSFGSGLRFWSF